jgi:glycosyltransferase involved in cell wall biosynthesis
MMPYSNKKIRAAFFADMLIADFDGAARTMYQLLNRIDKDEFEFLFVCGVGPNVINGFPCLHVPTFTLPMNKNYKMALPGLAKKKMFEALDAFSPHVIHIATPPFLGQFALKYATKHNFPVLSIYHTHFISYIDYYFAHASFLIHPVKSKISITQKTFYNQCRLIYVPSESITAELMQSGVEECRMKIWKRCIDTSLFSPQKRSALFMHNLTGNNRKNILFVSRLVWEKNLETLFRIYDSIQEQQLPYNLVIAGDGMACATCEKRMLKAFFTGKLEHDILSQLYASSDVFVFPSMSEAYGNVVLEAMASGLPCVIADGGGSRDFVKHGENGFKCPPNDVKAYTNRLIQILENEELARRLTIAGLQYSQLLDWEILAGTYFNDITLLGQSTFSAITSIPTFL